MQNFAAYSDADLFKTLRQPKAVAERAFAELYARHSQRVYVYCLKIIGEEADALDVFQTTFLKFHAAAQNDAVVENVPAYLLRIARNLCFDKKREFKPTIPFEEFHGASRDNSYENKELISLINTALELLDIEYREALVLHEYEGLSYNEIAEITGDTIPALKNRVWRAKQKIRHILSPYLADLEK
jgi:RNA polymerase sigma-70 factor (ECF subfamily)